MLLSQSGPPELHDDLTAPAAEAEPTPTQAALYHPAPRERQLTLRAVLVGCMLGAGVAAMNLSFGLKTGWSVGGSVIAAILSYAVFAGVIRPRERFTVLETNIAQTTGSAAGNMTTTASMLAALPAMAMLGHDFSYLELTLWLGSVAWIGVFFAVPLRRQMVVVDQLRFPSGTATAHTIVAMHGAGHDALRKARWLAMAGVLAGLFALTTYFVPVVGQPPLAIWLPFLAVPAAYGFSLIVSPMMLGAGVLMGSQIAASLVLGAVIAWGGLAPWVESQGWVSGPLMSYATGARGWILWPGVALMVGSGLMNLALSWRLALRIFRRSRGPVQEGERHVPHVVWMAGLALATGLTVIAADRIFHIPPFLTVVAIALSSVLSIIAARSMGETDINPIGGMGKVTQLAFGALAPGQMATNLMAAGITGAGASQAADMMQDLKTGHLLGASPRAQLKAQMVGIVAGIVVCVPVYKLFVAAHGIGTEQLPVPAAQAWKAMAELLGRGTGALPLHAEWAVLAAGLVGAVLTVLRRLRPNGSAIPSGVAMGIAFLIPAYYCLAMGLGAAGAALWKRARPAAVAVLGLAVASGLVAGEGLMGIVTAVLSLVGVPPLVGP